MTPAATVISLLGAVLAGTLLAGVLLRERSRECLSFPIYLVAVLVPSFLFAAWPERFYTWDNYILKEVVHNVLKFAIALELGYRTLAAFPSALVQAKRLVLAVLVLVGIVAAAGTSSPSTLAALHVEWHARVLNGTIWLFTGLAAVILWYRLPVQAFHKAILVGFVPYLLLFSVGMRAMLEMGQAQSFFLQRAHAIGYLVLLLYWNRAAWAPARAPSVMPAPVRTSQPEPA